MTRRLLTALLVLSSGCLRVEADAPICKSLALDFAGAPASAAARASISSDQTVTFGAGIDAKIFTHLRLAGGTITPGDGTPDLSFLNHVSLTVLPPAGSTLPELPLLAWTHQGTGAVPSIDLAAQDGDLIPYFAGGLKLHVSAGGSPPPGAWSLLVDLCADASVDDTVKLF